MTDLAPFAAAIDDVLATTAELCAALSEEQGRLPTDLEGWSVKDQLSHMVGLEQSLSGSPDPIIEVPAFGYIRNDFGSYMELHVHARRALPMRAVVDELIGLMPRRSAQLRSQVAEGDPEVAGPMGSTRKLSDSLPIRVLDLWAHEQDIRRAVGMAPRTKGFAADYSEARCLEAWGGLLPARAEIDGVLTIRSDSGDEVTVTLGDGGPTAEIVGDRATLTEMGFGRGPVDERLGRCGVTGDPAVVAAVREHLAFTP